MVGLLRKEAVFGGNGVGLLNHRYRSMTKHSNNYWEKRGATPKAVVKLCKELGLNPASGNHLLSAFEILKGKAIANRSY